MKFIFLDLQTNKELVLPVTPSSYEIPHGINVETINIHSVGDVNLPGTDKLASFGINCMFPAKAYPFNQPGTVLDPFYYVNMFRSWCENRTILRFIITETPINLQVFIEEITCSEKDGTGDVYATIYLREYRTLKVAAVSTETGNVTRETERTDPPVQTHVVKSGDTLSAICRKYYGNASLYPGLAKYNNIKNPHLIYVGQVIKLPSKNLLL